MSAAQRNASPVNRVQHFDSESSLQCVRLRARAAVGSFFERCDLTAGRLISPSTEPSVAVVRLQNNHSIPSQPSVDQLARACGRCANCGAKISFRSFRGGTRYRTSFSLHVAKGFPGRGDGVLDFVFRFLSSEPLSILRHFIIAGPRQSANNRGRSLSVVVQL